MIDDISETSTDDGKSDLHAHQDVVAMALSMVDDLSDSEDDGFADPQEMNFTDSHLTMLMTKSELYAAAANMATADFDNRDSTIPKQSDEEDKTNRKPPPPPLSNPLVASLPSQKEGDFDSSSPRTSSSRSKSYRTFRKGSVDNGNRMTPFDLSKSMTTRMIDMSELFSDDDDDDANSNTTGSSNSSHDDDEIDHALFLMERAMIYNQDRIASTKYIEDTMQVDDLDKKIAAKAMPKKKTTNTANVSKENINNTTANNAAANSKKKKHTFGMSKPKFLRRLKNSDNNQSSGVVWKDDDSTAATMHSLSPDKEASLISTRMKRYYIIMALVLTVGAVVTTVIILVSKNIHIGSVPETVSRKTFLREQPMERKE